MNIIKRANEYQISNSFTVLNTLPNNVFCFDSEPFKGPFLREMDPLVIPPKVYGNDTKFINHVLNTWNKLNQSVGILLTGEKGLGKSFTANLLCCKLNKEMPIIKITRAIGLDEGLIDLLNSIDQPHCILIDEFEKIFLTSTANNVNQQSFLSFLDGANSNNVKKLFVITTNNTIDDLFINRPTRLRYVRDYFCLDYEVVKEIIEDRLKYSEFQEDLLNNLDIETTNIDILIQLIDEINLHKKPYSDFKEFFNYRIKDNIFNVYFVNPEGREVMIDTIEKKYLNQLISGINNRWDFASFVKGDLEFNFCFKNMPGAIKKVNNREYEMTVSLLVTDYSKENAKNTESLIKLSIRKDILNYVF